MRSLSHGAQRASFSSRLSFVLAASLFASLFAFGTSAAAPAGVSACHAPVVRRRDLLPSPPQLHPHRRLGAQGWPLQGVWDRATTPATSRPSSAPPACPRSRDPGRRRSPQRVPAVTATRRPPAPAGYRGTPWGENIGCWDLASAYKAVLASHRAFQAEKATNGGHWRNIKNPRYRYVGIGVWKANGHTRLVMDFYRPVALRLPTARPAAGDPAAGARSPPCETVAGRHATRPLQCGGARVCHQSCVRSLVQSPALSASRHPEVTQSMRILVVGAGGVGTAVVAIAARRGFFEHMVVADYDAARVEHALAQVAGDARFSGARVDASNTASIVALIREHGITHVLNAVDPRFVMPIFDACLRGRRGLHGHGDVAVPPAPGHAVRAHGREAGRPPVRDGRRLGGRRPAGVRGDGRGARPLGRLRPLCAGRAVQRDRRGRRPRRRQPGRATATTSPRRSPSGRRSRNASTRR